ncbi:MAG: hypothetical protein AAFV93_19295 [Chloroflexota bacterium]
MPINVTWDNDDHKIVRHVYPQQWDLNDFHRAIEDNASLIESVTHRVDVIADLTQNNLPQQSPLPLDYQGFYAINAQ